MNSVLVTLHREPEGWWADSPALPGWSAAADSLTTLRELIAEGVRFALDVEHVDVREVLDAPPSHGILFDFVKNQVNTVTVRLVAAVGVVG